MKNILNKNSMSYLLPILSGIFIGTSYIPFPPWAIFFAFVPLWFAWQKNSNLKYIWWSGWLCQFLLTLIGFNWVAHTLHEFGRLPLWVSYIALAGFCSFANLHIPLAGVAWGLLVKRYKLTPHKAVILLPALTWIFESYYPMIFDWNFGYTWLWANFPAFHLGELIGFKGLSLITILINLLFFIAIFKPGRQKWISLVSFAVLFLALNLSGHALYKRIPEFDKQTKALIIQANIGNLEKQYAFKGLGFRDSILDQYTELTEEGLKQHGPVDFVVWPETAFPDEMNRPGFFSKYVLRLRSFLDRHEINLITGSYGQLAETRQSTNSLFFLYPHSGSPHTPIEPTPYNKTALLAFGEYIPGASMFPILKTWLPQVADFARGPGPTVKDYKGLMIGPQICYEGLFDSFTRSLARQDAQILVNVTNDSWYGTWQEPYQHLYMTLARAIEVRRPLIRSTNTGISTVVLASGEILEKSPLDQAWQGAYEVPYWSKPPRTLFTSWGYWIPVVFSFAWLVIGILWQLKITSKDIRESKTRDS